MKLTKALAFSLVSANYLTEEVPSDFLEWDEEKHEYAYRYFKLTKI